MVTQTPIAPGARIVVRDEEWLVRRVDPASDGGRLLTCDGVSDLVRGQSSLFLTALEGPIEVLDHAERCEDSSWPSRRDGSRALSARARLAGAAPATQPYLDYRCGRTGQDPGSRHSGHRTHPAGPRQAYPGGDPEEHAYAVPERVVEPFFDTASASGFAGA